MLKGKTKAAAGQKTLSIVVPAYNEAGRIKPLLSELLAFRKKNAWLREVIVVNDGSGDATLQVLEKFKPGVKVISYPRNQGKGFAVKKGLLAASSELVAFMDADGSISPSEIPKMVQALQKFDLVTGSRALAESSISVKPPLKRRIASFGFNNLTNLLFGIGQPDVLCGFKGMRSKLAKKIVPRLVSRRWVFDVEIFARARKAGASIGAVPIEWKYRADSKMHLGATTLRIFIDLLRLKARLLRS